MAGRGKEVMRFLFFPPCLPASLAFPFPASLCATLRVLLARLGRKVKAMRGLRPLRVLLLFSDPSVFIFIYFSVAKTCLIMELPRDGITDDEGDKTAKGEMCPCFWHPVAGS